MGVDEDKDLAVLFVDPGKLGTEVTRIPMFKQQAKYPLLPFSILKCHDCSTENIASLYYH